MPTMKVLSCNLPADLAEAIENWAASEGWTVSAAINFMITDFYSELLPGQSLRRFYPNFPKPPKPGGSIWDKL